MSFQLLFGSPVNLKGTSTPWPYRLSIY